MVTVGGAIGGVVGSAPIIIGGAFVIGTGAIIVLTNDYAADYLATWWLIYNQRRDLPSTGVPNSSTSWEDGLGNGTIRDYGPDGRAIKDFDFGHHPDLGEPHVHDWDWSRPKFKRRPGRSLNPNE